MTAARKHKHLCFFVLEDLDLKELSIKTDRRLECSAFGPLNLSGLQSVSPGSLLTGSLKGNSHDLNQ